MCWAFSLINKITLIKSPFYFFNVLAQTWTTEEEDEATTNKSVKLCERNKKVYFEWTTVSMTGISAQ